MPHVFLSYAKEDSENVRRTHARLQKDGLQVWIDERDLLPGHEWESTISGAIRTSAAFVVFLSRHSVSKTGHIQKEIREALEIMDRRPDGSVFIVPVRLDDCDVPEKLKRWQWIDLRKRGGYNRLRDALISHGAERKPPSRDYDPGVLTVFEHAGDHLLFDTLKTSRRFHYGKLGRTHHVLGQGHFVLVRKGLPVVFQTLRPPVVERRRMSPETIEGLMPSNAPWRRPTALVHGTAMHPDSHGIILSSHEDTSCVNLKYWRLGLLFAPSPKVYVTTGGGSLIYVEQDDRTVMAIAPYRLTDAERVSLAVPGPRRPGSRASPT